MSLPYMGSKRKLAPDIYRVVKKENPDATVLVDPFCGGFSVSEYFIKRGWTVIANDYNKHIAALLTKILKRDLKEKDMNRFISRKEFHDIIDHPSRYEDWLVGFVIVVWSFGNKGSSYLYGPDKEPEKRALHKMIVERDGTDVVRQRILPIEVVTKITNLPNRHLRRKAFRMAMKGLRRIDMEHLERVEHLERLQHINRLLGLKDLEITSLDYRDVEIPKGAVVYCDPPYQNTASYAVGGFDNRAFWEWVRSLDNPVYISEYSAPQDFVPVYEKNKRITLSKDSNKKKTVEKLYKKRDPA